MKALLLTREYPPEVYGGAGVHVHSLSRALARHIAVEVRTFGDQEVRAENLVVRGFRFAQEGPGDAPTRFLAALQALRVCVGFNAQPIDADLVHCHTWYAAFGGVLARTLYGIPLVVTAHSLEPLRPWKRDQLGRGADVSAWVERAALEAADAVVAVSQDMRQDVLRHFAVPPEKVHVISNGIDPEEYRPAPGRARLARFGIDPGRPTVLFLGRISRQKGILHLIRAVRHLGPEAQVVLCAGAPDTAEVAVEVEDAVRAVQALRGGVIWIREMVDRPTAAELYSQAAVFCCPSIYEPFGIINLEAMACETPVVASAVGGIPEVVAHGETGYLVPVAREAAEPFEPLDPDRFARDLADALNRLLGDEALRRAMGAKARRRVLERFTWAAIARRTLALYESLVARSGRSPAPPSPPGHEGGRPAEGGGGLREVVPPRAPAAGRGRRAGPGGHPRRGALGERGRRAAAAPRGDGPPAPEAAARPGRSRRGPRPTSPGPRGAGTAPRCARPAPGARPRARPAAPDERPPRSPGPRTAGSRSALPAKPGAAPRRGGAGPAGRRPWGRVTMARDSWAHGQGMARGARPSARPARAPRSPSSTRARTVVPSRAATCRASLEEGIRDLHARLHGRLPIMRDIEMPIRRRLSIPRARAGRRPRGWRP